MLLGRDSEGGTDGRPRARRFPSRSVGMGVNGWSRVG